MLKNYKSVIDSLNKSDTEPCASSVSCPRFVSEGSITVEPAKELLRLMSQLNLRY